MKESSHLKKYLIGDGTTTQRYIPPAAPKDEAGIFGEAVSKGENFGKYHKTPVQCTPGN